MRCYVQKCACVCVRGGVCACRQRSGCGLRRSASAVGRSCDQDPCPLQGDPNLPLPHVTHEGNLRKTVGDYSGSALARSLSLFLSLSLSLYVYIYSIYIYIYTVYIYIYIFIYINCLHQGCLAVRTSPRGLGFVARALQDAKSTFSVRGQP